MAGGIRKGLPNFWQKARKSWRIAMMVTTMPWMCLQAAIEQILQEPDYMTQEKQLLEWQRLKNTELMNVSFAVRGTFRLRELRMTIDLNRARSSPLP